MIFVKNSEQIRLMKTAGRITGEALALAGEMVREGVTTKQLDDCIRRHIESCGARPSFLGYGGFPGSACISINDEVIHGIPSAKRVLKEGDIVKIDVGAFIGGYHGDSANTFPVGRVSEEALRLIEATKRSFELGVEAASQPGARLGDVGAAIDGYVTKMGYSTVKKFVGHGIGQDLHEDPNVPNFGTPGRGVRLCNGMTIAIEPMVNAGGAGVYVLPDGWTVKTTDGSLSAHYEHTVALTADGPILLTKI
ncbi:MAG: type I methionyl aminopeptidase [Clostridia bacterium]|jgi:methionyl aminopeptidase|nr:type I methionyl aminopeptidase [Clostridia bacterium]MBQ5886038.1 type I methionyl aminopeptidase [Clostridia bacterium]